MRIVRLAVPMALVLLPAAATAAVQAPVLKWQRGGCTSWCETGWYASPAVADLDGNGSKEVVWSAHDTFILAGATGATVASWPNGQDRASGGGSVGRCWPGVVVADIDGDGQLEIATVSDGWVSVLSRDGYFEPGWPQQPTPGDELRTLAVYDLEGDGNMEILVASTRDQDQWYVFEHDGTVRPGWPQLPAGGQYATGCFNQNVAVGDLDGTGYAEIVGPNDTHYVDAFYADGTSIPAHAMFGAGKFWRNTGVWIDLVAEIRGYGNCGPEDRPNWNSGGCIVVDVDGNGVNEVVGVGNVHDCSFSPYLDIYDQPYIWKGDRSRFANATRDWTVLPVPGGPPLSEDYNVIETSQPNAVAADLDGDGEMEILYASYDGAVHCYRLDKTVPGNWPVEVYNPAEGFFRFATEPTVADLDNDGSAEVIFGSWPQKSSNGVGYLHIASAGGNELYRVPVPAVAGDWNGILAAPTLADIDGDADLEAVVGTSGTGVVAYDLPGTAGARVIWGTGRGTQQRFGGYLASPSITAEFSATPRLGAAPLAVQFTDLSTGAPSGWLWAFGDAQTSTTQSPGHTYTAAGLYNVSLTITKGTSTDTETKASYINVTSGATDKVLAGAGPGPGNTNMVKILTPDGVGAGQFTPYSAGSYGTNARSGAITGGTPSVLTGPGPGPVYGPQVRAFASTGTALGKVNFFAYGTLRFGVGAEGGDVESDGYDEILTGAGPGAVFGPHVRGFDYDNAAVTAMAKISFFAYGTLKWGVNVASASIDGDPPAEIVTGAGPGSVFAPTVRGFNYDGGPLTAIAKINFNAFATGTFGANVALGGVDADGPEEILVGRGAGPANAAQLRGYNFDGATIAALQGLDGTPFATLFGVQVASGEMTGSAPADVQAGAGADPAADARHAAYAYAGSALAPLGYSSFVAFPGLPYGLKVGDGAF